MTGDRYNPEDWTARAWSWSGSVLLKAEYLTADAAKRVASDWIERADVARSSAVPRGAEGWRDAES